MFDIGTIVEKDSQTLELVHPQTGAAIGASIEFAGPGHAKRRKIEMQRARALRARLAKRGRIEFTDPVEDEEYELERLVACTLSWEGICRDGKPIPCTPDEVTSVFESAAWMRRQAVAFLDEASNFLDSTASD